MKKLVVVLVVVLLSMLIFATVQAAPNDNACWGQASAVFAQMGVMGEHSADPDEDGVKGGPRIGLRNLARSLYDQGLIPDDSMASLGVFVDQALGLSVEACID